MTLETNNVFDKASRALKEHLIGNEEQVAKELHKLREKSKNSGDITVDEYLELAKSYQEADSCPKCGYPKHKKGHEDFERCEGCDWTSEES